MAGETGEVTARKLRTGEIAVWDHDERTVLLVSATSDLQSTVRVLRGATLKALEEALGEIVMLV